jgi:RHS repeat-associated protein
MKFALIYLILIMFVFVLISSVYAGTVTRYVGNLAEVKDGEVTFKVNDLRGSTRVVINGSNGDIIATSHTLPFGQSIKNQDIRFDFTGKERDETGNHYFNARYYDSDLGKFLSVDPVEDNHAYAYVSNNPYRYIDPTGMFPDDVPEKMNVVKDFWLQGQNDFSPDALRQFSEPIKSGLNQLSKYGSPTSKAVSTWDVSAWDDSRMPITYSDKLAALTLIYEANSISNTGVDHQTAFIKIGEKIVDYLASSTSENDVIQANFLTIRSGKKMHCESASLLAYALYNEFGVKGVSQVSGHLVDAVSIKGTSRIEFLLDYVSSETGFSPIVNQVSLGRILGGHSAIIGPDSGLYNFNWKGNELRSHGFWYISDEGGRYFQKGKPIDYQFNRVMSQEEFSKLSDFEGVKRNIYRMP